MKKNNKTKNKDLEKVMPIIAETLKKHGVKKAGIFGSYATGEQKEDSDIDILIEPPKGLGLGFVTINLELEDKLKKRVDLLTYRSINALLKKRILKEEIRVL